MRNIEKKKKVLLIEPGYSNKYPPVGLMKLSTYHKQLGYEVVFIKGEYSKFIIEQITEKCVCDLTDIDSSIDWFSKKDLIFDYIKTRRKESFNLLKIQGSDMEILLTSKLDEYRSYYHRKEWEKEPEWDRVFVTTLFTFYWNQTIEAIEFAKKLVKKDGILMVGGVLATIQPEAIEEATGVKPYCGVLDKPGILDKEDDRIIDNLALDYSILDEIDYQYPMSNAYYGYTTRGCIRKCAFCAVPTLEPIYNSYIPLKDRIEQTRLLYGDQKDLLLMDNNILASKELPRIIEDIIDCGFGKNAHQDVPDVLEISIRNLTEGINDRAYIRKCQRLLFEFCNKLKPDDSLDVYRILSKYHLLKFVTSKKENILMAYQSIKPIYDKYYKKSKKLRFVDFNQGVDARLFTDENVKLLGSIALRPLRIAFDDMKTKGPYEKAIRMSHNVGIKNFSNYLLYNFKDKPIDLYHRLKINVDLSNELNISIYSFPMKYHPLKGEFSHNRDYIGDNWNRKFIRAIQLILNSTKGKIGRSISFFNEAFGETEEEFKELLVMPEPLILYRFFFKWLEDKSEYSTSNWRLCWTECMNELTENEKDELLSVIYANKFDSDKVSNLLNPKAIRLIRFYQILSKEIITEGTKLYELKKIYDMNPTQELRRKKVL